MNPWEIPALEYNYPTEDGNDGRVVERAARPPGSSSLIYPGLYCPSGFDMVSILARVAARPNAKVNIGAVDASCALLLCDLQQPDVPIVYASEPFLALTGYSLAEILGRNCRFLQAPGGDVSKNSPRQYVDKEVLRKMRRAVEKNTELQVEVTNFKKNGVAFQNLLAMVPIPWDSQDYRYSVGFQVDKSDL